IDCDLLYDTSLSEPEIWIGSVDRDRSKGNKAELGVVAQSILCIRVQLSKDRITYIRAQTREKSTAIDLPTQENGIVERTRGTRTLDKNGSFDCSITPIPVSQRHA